MLGHSWREPFQVAHRAHGTGWNRVNYSTTTALNETGKCAIANGYSLVFNSGLTTNNNSNPINALNNGRTELISAGVEYAKGAGTLTRAGKHYRSELRQSNRGGAAALGLATDTDFHSFTLNYTRQINPNLSVSGEVGLVGVTSGFSLGLPKTLLPIYTLSANWSLTPRLALFASASRNIAPPTTVIANAEQSYNASLGLTYQLTPKGRSTLPVRLGIPRRHSRRRRRRWRSRLFSFNTQNIYTVNAGMTYAMTPFMTASLNASYNERVANHFITAQDVVTVSLSYRPH